MTPYLTLFEQWEKEQKEYRKKYKKSKGITIRRYLLSELNEIKDDKPQWIRDSCGWHTDTK